MAAALGLLRPGIPAEDGPALAGPLSVEGVAKLRGGPEAPVGRAVALLLAMDESQRLQLAPVLVRLMLAQPSLIERD